MEGQEVIERIIQGFETFRNRPNLDLVAEQFMAGEIAFLVDRRGIRIIFEEDSGDLASLA